MSGVNINSIDPKSSALSSAQVLTQRATFGENRLDTHKPVSGFYIFLGQFKSPLIYIILFAAGISVALGEIGDFFIIIAVVAINVFLGFFQEFQAQQSYLSLRNLLKPTARVTRDGLQQIVEVWEIVPGDVVAISAGDKVCADGVLLETVHLAVDEALLTGESSPVTKSVVQLSADNNDAGNVFMGSTVVTGRGLFRVTQIGSATQLGQIASSLGITKELATPLQIRLAAFGRFLTVVVVGICIAIFAAGIIQGKDVLEMLRTSIILATAAIPEGLIIAVTVILVLGMRKTLKRHGLVKKLLAVETLGSVTVICTDKTGTLTEGRMSVNRVDLVDKQKSLEAIVLCNNNQGPLEVALWEYAQSTLASDPQVLFDSCKRQDEILFSSDTKFMVTQVANSSPSADVEYFLKGAPEVVLEKTSLDSDAKRKILAQCDEWAMEGLRLIAVAHKVEGTLTSTSDFVWLGVFGITDPIRREVSDSILLAQQAGIQIKMITGDYMHTAVSVAKLVGFDVTHTVLEGTDIQNLSDVQLQEKVKTTSIFARVKPQDKLRIVEALQANGEVVAMIGDGVNDAPALVRANIGVVVGSASDVAKESADLILLDSNFATVVSSIEEGRVTFDNIRKVVAYVLSNSFEEVFTIFIALMLGWPAPLMVAQILWINLICDGPSDIVLGFEPKERGIMKMRPRPSDEPILSRMAVIFIVVISLASSMFALVVFGYFLNVEEDVARGQSIVFASFAVNSIVYIFAYRSMRTPIWRMNNVRQNKPLIWVVFVSLFAAVLPFMVPALGNMLQLVALTWSEWALVAAFALGLLIVVELGKLVMNRNLD